jgi:RNA 2',3'-cyclic 3'-phosphodiesterase
MVRCTVLPVSQRLEVEYMFNDADKIRAFIALELPEAVKSFLSRVSSDLKRAGGDVRWVRAEGVHLTLKFLGDIRGDLVPVLGKELEPVFSRHSPVELEVAGIGAFPNPARPRVIWAGLSDASGVLVHMASQVDAVLEPLGFPGEKRAFNPHLTLGRVRSNKSSGDLMNAIRRGMDIRGPAFVADHAVLFQSILKETGAEYRGLWRYELSSR